MLAFVGRSLEVYDLGGLSWDTCKVDACNVKSCLECGQRGQHTHSKRYLMTPKNPRLKIVRKNACRQNESNEVIR